MNVELSANPTTFIETLKRLSKQLDALTWREPAKPSREKISNRKRTIARAIAPVVRGMR